MVQWPSSCAVTASDQYASSLPPARNSWAPNSVPNCVIGIVPSHLPHDQSTPDPSQITIGTCALPGKRVASDVCTKRATSKARAAPEKLFSAIVMVPPDVRLLIAPD